MGSPLTVPGVKRDGRFLWLPKRPLALEAVDFTGFEVWADSAAAMVGPVFRCAAAGSILRVGENAPADVTLIDASFDGTGMSAAMASAFQVLRGAALTVKGGRFDNAQRLHFKSWGDALVLERVWVGKYGLGATKESHNEAIFINGGRFEARRCTFDSRGGPNAQTIGQTAQINLEAEIAPIEVRIDGGTMIGARDLGLLFPIQARARNFDVTIRVRNLACQRGTSSSFVGPTEEKGRVIIIDEGGNTDLDTGAPVDWSRPATPDLRARLAQIAALSTL